MGFEVDELGGGVGALGLCAERPGWDVWAGTCTASAPGRMVGMVGGKFRPQLILVVQLRFMEPALGCNGSLASRAQGSDLFLEGTSGCTVSACRMCICPL